MRYYGYLCSGQRKKKFTVDAAVPINLVFVMPSDAVAIAAPATELPETPAFPASAAAPTPPATPRPPAASAETPVNP